MRFKYEMWWAGLSSGCKDNNRERAFGFQTWLFLSALKFNRHADGSN